MDFSKPGTKASISTPVRGDRPGVRVGAAFSAMVGWSATRTVPAALRGFAYRTFARAVGANLDEVELALDEYPSLGDFFARRLVSGARVQDAAADAIISPCDGVLAARGTAVGGEMIQAKGRLYQLADLLADDERAAGLTGGEYATIYLSPRDYHRVHAPVGARVLGYDYVPGALWPVNPKVAARRDQLLSRNERVVIWLDAGAHGRIAVVMVAATGVGNMQLAEALGGGTGAVDSVIWRAAREPRRVELSNVTVARGDELGAFRLGSTVVMVFEPGKVALTGDVGQAMQFGQRLGATGKGAR